MSNLKQQIENHMKDAMRSKDKPRLAVIRLIMAAIKQREVDERITLDDEQITTVLDKMCKQRRDSISQFEQGGRSDLAEKEQFELDLIKTYLPEPLTDTELEQLITDAITETQATSMRDMGKVMAIIKSKAQGRADMAAVSKAIKAKLN